MSVMHSFPFPQPLFITDLPRQPLFQLRPQLPTLA
jgi:hypothetical protein